MDLVRRFCGEFCANFIWISQRVVCALCLCLCEFGVDAVDSVDAVDAVDAVSLDSGSLNSRTLWTSVLSGLHYEMRLNLLGSQDIARAIEQ